METKSLAPTSAPGIRVPASELDASEIFVTSGAGQLGQMIVRGRRWWYRPDINSDVWPYSGILFEGETCSGTGCNNPFPEKIDTMAAWRDPATGKIAQIVTAGNKYWYRVDTNVAIWTRSEPLFNEGCTGSGCPLPFDSNCTDPTCRIDTMTVYTSGNNFAQIVTKGNKWWYRGSMSSGTKWSSSGVLFKKPDGNGASCTDVNGKPCSFPTDFIDSFTMFPRQGKTAQLATKDKNYWFTPDSSSYSWTKSDITLTVNPKSKNFKISPYIYGANLVWHPRHIADISTVKKLILNLNITTIRFPGGCGGDSYAQDWNTTINNQDPSLRTFLQGGWPLANYMSLFDQTSAVPFYTANIEGESGGHTQFMNGHGYGSPPSLAGLKDYPGTVNESIAIINSFGGKIKNVEVGNEPWATATLNNTVPNSYYLNWRESWTWDNYYPVYNQIANNLSSDVKVTLAWDLKPLIINGQWETQSQWETRVKNMLNQVNRVDYIQVHPYGSPVTTPLARPMSQEKYLLNLRRIFALSSKPSVGIAATEYNVFCWDKVFYTDDNGQTYQEGTKDTNVGKVEQALYIAEMLGVYVKAGVKQAMIWHLVEDMRYGDNGWKCGLAELTGIVWGPIYETPSYYAFQWVSNNIRGSYIPVEVYEGTGDDADESEDLKVVVVKIDSSKVNILIINPSRTGKSLNISLPGVSTLSRDTLQASSLSALRFTETRSASVPKSNDVFTISIPAYSISIVKQL